MSVALLEPPALDDRYEVVGGERVELPPMAGYSGMVGSLLAALLFRWLPPDRLGEVQVEAMFLLDAGSDLRRRPDVAWFSKERRAYAFPMPLDGDFPFPPDLAVEVVSPSDRFGDVLAKKDEYLAHGVREVWIVAPASREVQIYDADGSRIVGRGGTLQTPLLPGWSLPVADLFPPRAS